MTEMFPPTELELEQIIRTLKQQLEDPIFEDDWKALFLELEERENQLKQLTIQNNSL